MTTEKCKTCKLPCCDALFQVLHKNTVVPSRPEISIWLYFWDLLDIFSFYFVPPMGIYDFDCSFEARSHFYLMEKVLLTANLISAFTSNKTSTSISNLFFFIVTSNKTSTSISYRFISFLPVTKLVLAFPGICFTFFASNKYVYYSFQSQPF